MENRGLRMVAVRRPARGWSETLLDGELNPFTRYSTVSYPAFMLMYYYILWEKLNESREELSKLYRCLMRSVGPIH
jgi:hypothetical protein